MLSMTPELARSALEAAPVAMIIVDASGVIRFANRQVSALFGYAHAQVIDQPVELLLPERSRARQAARRNRYANNVRARPMGVGLELYGRRRDGSEFPVEISLSPIEDHNDSLIAAAIRDVSDRKRVEAELVLARQAAEHTRELADHARALADQARDSADRANQAKSRFLATASHALREPLQTLSLLNGTLRRMITEPEAATALDQQERAIAAMSRLLNALLDISKLESGAIEPNRSDFAMAALFQELRSEFAQVARAKGLEFLIEDTNEAVHCDRALIEQVLRNLVSNAIKYTCRGHVTLRCWHDHGKTVFMEVRDSGVGIPPNQLRYIYDEFYQVGVPPNMTRDGYGLGLSIVQRIVKLLELQLHVRSEVGKGSIFSLALPIAAGRIGQAGLAPSATGIPCSRLQHPGVLLLEDDPAVRDATRMLLKVEGYRVTAVGSISEALEQVGEALDLIVADYHLGKYETGTDAIAAVRAAVGRPLKAVLITGDTSAAIKELTSDPYLRIASKPVKAEELLNLMQDLNTY